MHGIECEILTCLKWQFPTSNLIFPKNLSSHPQNMLSLLLTISINGRISRICEFILKSISLKFLQKLSKLSNNLDIQALLE